MVCPHGGIWSELIIVVVGAALGWFSRHFQQPPDTRPDWSRNMRKKKGTYR